jgi:predicted  nucleic acid-binding Zn-ribbon protein
MREDELTRVRSAVETECDPVRRDCETAASTLHELQAAAQKIAGEVESTKVKIGAQQQLLMAMEANIQSGGLSGDAFVQAVAARGTMERALSELQRVVREQEGERQALSRKVQVQQKRVNDAETQLESRESVLRQVEQQLAKLRSETTAAIASLQP